jgi:hypothetical protein
MAAGAAVVTRPLVPHPTATAAVMFSCVSMLSGCLPPACLPAFVRYSEPPGTVCRPSISRSYFRARSFACRHRYCSHVCMRCKPRSRARTPIGLLVSHRQPCPNPCTRDSMRQLDRQLGSHGSLGACTASMREVPTLPKGGRTCPLPCCKPWWSEDTYVFIFCLSSCLQMAFFQLASSSYTIRVAALLGPLLTPCRPPWTTLLDPCIICLPCCERFVLCCEHIEYIATLFCAGCALSGIS